MNAGRSGWRAGIAGLVMGLLSASGASGQMSPLPGSAVAPEPVESSPVMQGSQRRLRLLGGEALQLAADGASISLFTASPAKRLRTWPLAEVRRNASLTLLPSGRALIWGGHDARGELQPGGLWFDPELRALEPATGLSLASRASHTATVLTDGRVFFAGGRTDGPMYELWSEGATDAIAVPAGRQTQRLGHRAQLEANGEVRLYGGAMRRNVAAVTRHSLILRLSGCVRAHRLRCRKKPLVWRLPSPRRQRSMCRLRRAWGCASPNASASKT